MPCHTTHMPHISIGMFHRYVLWNVVQLSEVVVTAIRSPELGLGIQSTPNVGCTTGTASIDFSTGTASIGFSTGVVATGVLTLDLHKSLM